MLVIWRDNWFIGSSGFSPAASPSFPLVAGAGSTSPSPNWVESTITGLSLSIKSFLEVLNAETSCPAAFVLPGWAAITIWVDNFGVILAEYE